MNKEEIIELDENDVQHLFDAGVNMAGEIKELENQIKHYRSTNIHLIDKNKFLQQENKQLKEQLKATNKGLRKVINKRKKWENRYYKQKHILDELKKWLKEIKNECFEIYSSPITQDATREFYYIDVIDKTLNKLQELKGSDSNE